MHLEHKPADQINERPFQKREGSRKSAYLAKEKPLLIPLPSQPFEIYASKRLTVQFNYHVCFEENYYSVPFSYSGKEVDVKATRNTVTISAKGERIAMHRRKVAERGAYVTDPMHMPEKHREYLKWDRDRFAAWAKKAGPATADVMGCILESRSALKWNYKPCRMLVELASTYPPELLEEACEKTLLANRNPSYKTVSMEWSRFSGQLFKHLQATSRSKSQGAIYPFLECSRCLL